MTPDSTPPVPPIRKHIVITGGAEFHGSHPSGHLLVEGNDNPWANDHSAGRISNIALRLVNITSGHSAAVTLPLFVVADELYNLACSA